MAISNNTQDNEQKKFVDSPSRGGKSSAVEVVSTSVSTDPNGDVVPSFTGGIKSEFSSNTALLNGESFNSGIVDLNGYQFLAGEIFADKDGTFTGTWYDDIIGSNVMRVFTAPYTAANGLSFLSVPVLSKYFSLSFENNSGEDQTAFNMRVNLTNESYSPQLIQVDQFLPTNAIATVTRSVITALGTDGTYKNIGSNDVGALNTSSFLLDVASGKYPTYKAGTKFGSNSEVDTNSDPEDVWNGGGIYTGQPTTGIAQTVTIESSDSSDNSTGSGARTVRILGLDIDGNNIEEVLTLNGTSLVTSSNQYWRLSRAIVLTAGSDGYNNGELIIKHSVATTNVFAVMPQFANQTAIAADTVPKGKTRIILSISSQIARANGSAGSANVRLLAREPGATFRAIRNAEVTTAYPYLSKLETGIVLEELTDIKWQVFSVSDQDTVCTAEFEYIDIDI